MNSSNSKILNIDGEETSFSSNKIQILISLGWFFHFLSIVCNICFYLVHPSEAKFRLNQAKIHVFGKEKDLWYPLKICFKYLKLCFTCACCRNNGEGNNNQQQEEQEMVHQNNTPWNQNHFILIYKYLYVFTWIDCNKYKQWYFCGFSYYF